MKRIYFLFASVLIIGLSSCEKCTDCKCTKSSFFDFPSTMPQEDQDLLEAAYVSNFNEQSEEVCAKRGDFDGEVSDWEAQSSSFSETNTYKGEEWSISITYDCTCEE
jgi:hypothetical protein